MNTSKLYGISLDAFLTGLEAKLNGITDVREILNQILNHEIEVLKAHYTYLMDRYRNPILEIDEEEFLLLLTVGDKLKKKRQKLKRYSKEI